MPYRTDPIADPVFAAFERRQAQPFSVDTVGAAPTDRPRYIVLPSTGSLPVVYDRVAERSIEGGRRFQPARALEIADELNATLAALPPAAPEPAPVAGSLVL